MKKHLLQILLFAFVLLNFNSTFAQHNWLQGAGSNANDEALGITHDLQGNIYSTGYFSQSARFDNFIISSSGMSDVFIAKQDSLGTFVWVAKAGGVMDEKATAIAICPNGEIMITGVFSGVAQFGSFSLTSMGNSQDIFVAKLDNNGNFSWAQSYGGTNTDIANDISVDSHGNSVIAGQFKDVSQFGTNTFTSVNYPLSMPLDGGQPSYDAVIFKINSFGNVIWAKQGAAKYDDRALKVETDNSQNIFVCGQFSDTLTFANNYNNNAFNAGFVMQMDSAGNEVWFHRLIATQFMIYDMKYADHRLYLTGDFQGTLVYLGTPNNYITNTFPNKTFAIKLNSQSGNYIKGSSEGSDNTISSRGIDVDQLNNIYTTGYFKCSFTPFSNAHGNGIFNSVGFRDVYVLKYDTTLTRTWEKQYGGIGDDYPTSLSVPKINHPVFAGSYTKNFNVTDGNHFASHVNDSISSNSNNGSVICGNNLYGKFITQKGWGNKDILLAQPVDLSCPLYDYFKRINGTCSLDTLMPTRYPLGDTISACDNISFQIITPTTVDSLQAPDWIYQWSNGSTNWKTNFTTTGWKYISYGYADNCRSFVDSFYVIIDHTPPTPIIQVYNALNMDAIPVGSCLHKTTIMSGDTALFVASNIFPGDTFLWTFPNGSTSTTDSIFAYTPGVYSLVSTSPSGNCSSGNCMALYIYGSGGSCGNLSALIPELVFTNPVFNASDTVRVCKNSLFEMQLVDSALFSAAMPTLLYTFANWSISGGYSFFPYASFATTFGSHIQNFQADSSGICSATATVLDPITGLPFFSITRNFYLDVHVPPSNIPLITGALFFCPGDTVTLNASGGNNYVWTGPGIVQQNSPVNDTVLVNFFGDYFLTSTTIDSVVGCTSIKNTSVTLNSVPSPFVTMNPIHGVICPFDSVLLSAELGANYVWYGPAGNVISTSQTVWVSTPGIYYYTFISPSGCGLVSDMAEVKEYSTPYLDAYPGTSLCAIGTVLLSVLSNDSAHVVWGAPFSGNSFSQIATLPGVYNVSVNFCNITTTTNITITGPTGNPVDIINLGADTICAQDTVVLFGSTGFVNYTWLPSNLSGPSIVSTGAGTYILNATNLEGCSSSDTITIYSYATVTPPIVRDTIVCPGSSLTITAQSSSNLIWYNDLFGGNIISTSDSVTISIGQNDTSFFVAATNGSCVSSPVQLTVHVLSTLQNQQISGNDHYCLGDTIDLQINNPANGIHYIWNGPGLVTIDTTHLFISPVTLLQAGNYSVYSSNGICSGKTDSLLISVSDIHLQQFTTSNYIICQYDSLILDTDTLQGSYLWNNFNIGNSINVTTTGIYYYNYTDVFGCIAVSDTVTVNVLTAPVLLPISDTSICINSPVILTANTNWPSTVSWYDQNNNLLNTGSSYGLNNVNQSTTIFTQAIDSSGCKSITDTIQILVLPLIPSPILSTNDTICEGDTLNLFANNLPGYTYYWVGPNGFTSNDINPFIAAASLSNTGNYSLYVQSGYCTSTTSDAAIFIMPLPILTTSGDTGICPGATAVLTATTTENNLLWSTGETIGSISVSPSQTTPYSVQTINRCASISETLLVTVHPLPIVDAGSDILLLLNESSKLTASGGIDYLWSPSAGLSCTDCETPTVSITQSQYYYVTVSDANQCSDTDSVYVTVLDVSTFYIPNAFSPNNDGLNDLFKVEGANIESINMIIYNRWGNKIFESNDKNKGWDGTEKGKKVEEGVYVYKLKITLTNGDINKFNGIVTVVR